MDGFSNARRHAAVRPPRAFFANGRVRTMYLFTDLSDGAFDGLLGRHRRKTERCLDFRFQILRWNAGTIHLSFWHIFERNSDGDTPNPMISTPSEPKFRRVGCGPFIPRPDCLPNGVSFFDLIFPCESPKFPGTPFTRELYFIPGPRRLRRHRQAPPSAPRGP